MPARISQCRRHLLTLTFSSNVSVITVGAAGTALPSAGEVNSSVACADAEGATTASKVQATASTPASHATRIRPGLECRTSRLIIRPGPARG